MAIHKWFERPSLQSQSYCDVVPHEFVLILFTRFVGKSLHLRGLFSLQIPQYLTTHFGQFFQVSSLVGAKKLMLWITLWSVNSMYLEPKADCLDNSELARVFLKFNS